MVTPTRFVVVVWLNDHWGVNVQTDDEAEAVRAFDAAEEHFGDGCAVLVNTRPVN